MIKSCYLSVLPFKNESYHWISKNIRNVFCFFPLFFSRGFLKRKMSFERESIQSNGPDNLKWNDNAETLVRFLFLPIKYLIWSLGIFYIFLFLLFSSCLVLCSEYLASNGRFERFIVLLLFRVGLLLLLLLVVKRMARLVALTPTSRVPPHRFDDLRASGLACSSSSFSSSSSFFWIDTWKVLLWLASG